MAVAPGPGTPTTAATLGNGAPERPLPPAPAAASVRLQPTTTTPAMVRNATAAVAAGLSGHAVPSVSQRAVWVQPNEGGSIPPGPTATLPWHGAARVSDDSHGPHAPWARDAALHAYQPSDLCGTFSPPPPSMTSYVHLSASSNACVHIYGAAPQFHSDNSRSPLV